MFGMYKKTSIFLLLIFYLLLYSSIFCYNHKESEIVGLGDNTVYLDIKKELDLLGENRSSSDSDKILINDNNAPSLKKFIEDHLKQFSTKCTKIKINKMPKVYLEFNKEELNNYNFRANENCIYLGDVALDIIFRSKCFEKYFVALLAHEFAHFCLGHCESTLVNECLADQLAFTFVDQPQDIAYAHIFHFLLERLVEVFTDYNFNKNEINKITSDILIKFIENISDFGWITKATSWQGVAHLIYAAILKTFEPGTISADEFIASLKQINQKSYLSVYFDKEYFELMLSRIYYFLSHPFEKEDHPSPALLFELCRYSK